MEAGVPRWQSFPHNMDQEGIRRGACTTIISQNQDPPLTCPCPEYFRRERSINCNCGHVGSHHLVHRDCTVMKPDGSRCQCNSFTPTAGVTECSQCGDEFAFHLGALLPQQNPTVLEQSLNGVHQGENQGASAVVGSTTVSSSIGTGPPARFIYRHDGGQAGPHIVSVHSLGGVTSSRQQQQHQGTGQVILLPASQYYANGQSGGVTNSISGQNGGVPNSVSEQNAGVQNSVGQGSSSCGLQFTTSSHGFGAVGLGTAVPYGVDQNGSSAAIRLRNAVGIDRQNQLRIQQSIQTAASTPTGPPKPKRGRKAKYSLVSNGCGPASSSGMRHVSISPGKAELGKANLTRIGPKVLVQIVGNVFIWQLRDMARQALLSNSVFKGLLDSQSVTMQVGAEIWNSDSGPKLPENAYVPADRDCFWYEYYDEAFNSIELFRPRRRVFREVVDDEDEDIADSNSRPASTPLNRLQEEEMERSASTPPSGRHRPLPSHICATEAEEDGRRVLVPVNLQAALSTSAESGTLPLDMIHLAFGVSRAFVAELDRFLRPSDTKEITQWLMEVLTEPDEDGQAERVRKLKKFWRFLAFSERSTPSLLDKIELQLARCDWAEGMRRATDFLLSVDQAWEQVSVQGKFSKAISAIFDDEGRGNGPTVEYFLFIRQLIFDQLAFEGDDNRRVPTLKTMLMQDKDFYYFIGQLMGNLACNDEVVYDGIHPKVTQVLKGRSLMGGAVCIEDVPEECLQKLLKKVELDESLTDAEKQNLHTLIDETQLLGFGPNEFFKYNTSTNMNEVRNDARAAAVKKLAFYSAFSSRSGQMLQIANGFNSVTKLQDVIRLGEFDIETGRRRSVFDPLINHLFPRAQCENMTQDALARRFTYQSEYALSAEKKRQQRAFLMDLASRVVKGLSEDRKSRRSVQRFLAKVGGGYYINASTEICWRIYEHNDEEMWQNIGFYFASCLRTIDVSKFWMEEDGAARCAESILKVIEFFEGGFNRI